MCGGGGCIERWGSLKMVGFQGLDYSSFYKDILKSKTVEQAKRARNLFEIL